MSFEIEVSSLAKLEILDAYDWYETKRKGLGEEFLDELDKFLKELLKNPKIHSYYQKPVRSGVLKTFPYSVTYETAGNIIYVYSVFMFRQNPQKRRLNK